MSATKTAPKGGQIAMKPTFKKKKKYKAPPGQLSDADLIAQYLQNGGTITRYATVLAEGALHSFDQGLSR